MYADIECCWGLDKRNYGLVLMVTTLLYLLQCTNSKKLCNKKSEHHNFRIIILLHTGERLLSFKRVFND